MIWKNDSELLWHEMILLGLVALSLILNGCAGKSVILTQSEMRPIVKAGTTCKVIWDGETQDMTMDQDRVLVPKGDYLECEILKNE